MTYLSANDLAILLARRRRTDGRLALLLDYDGTLTPIVDRPEEAILDHDTQRLLARLADRPDTYVALLTGRSLDGLHAVAGPLAGCAIVSNGGLRITLADGTDQPDAAFIEAVRLMTALERALITALAPRTGVRVEPKGPTLAVHWRQAPHHAEETRRRVERLIDTDRVRMLSGRCVLELRPTAGRDKADAARWLLERWQAGHSSAFFGDDVIDLSALTVVHQQGGVAVVVGDAVTPPDGALRIEGPTEVRQLLEALAED